MAAFNLPYIESLYDFPNMKNNYFMCFFTFCCIFRNGRSTLLGSEKHDYLKCISVFSVTYLSLRIFQKLNLFHFMPFQHLPFQFQLMLLFTYLETFLLYLTNLSILNTIKNEISAFPQIVPFFVKIIVVYEKSVLSTTFVSCNKKIIL